MKERFVEKWGAHLGLVALAILLTILFWPISQVEAQETGRSSGETFHEWLSGAANVTWNFIKGTVSGRQEEDEARERALNDEFADEAQEIRDEKIRFTNEIFFQISAPDYCQDRRIDQLADQCLRALSGYLLDRRNEIETLRAEIKEEVAARGKLAR